MKYFESELIPEPGPFSCGMLAAKGALCADGVRRNAHPTTDGIADTFFSIPMYVYVGRKRVYGYVTVETMEGFSTHTDEDPATVKFVAYTYRRHHALVGEGTAKMPVGTPA